MEKRKKIICPKCGSEMNHHADKVVHSTTAEEAKRVNLAFGGLLEELHACPACGAVASRPAD